MMGHDSPMLRGPARGARAHESRVSSRHTRMGGKRLHNGARAGCVPTYGLWRPDGSNDKEPFTDRQWSQTAERHDGPADEGGRVVEGRCTRTSIAWMNHGKLTLNADDLRENECDGWRRDWRAHRARLPAKITEICRRLQLAFSPTDIRQSFRRYKQRLEASTHRKREPKCQEQEVARRRC